MLEVDLRKYGLEKLRKIPALVMRIIKEVSNLAWRLMIRHVPFKTGFLRASIHPYKLSRSQTSVGPTAIYGRAVDQGLPGGPGRYVPAIGKRLTKSGRGHWPGFKGSFFIQKTYKEMVTKVPGLVRKMLNQHFYSPEGK